MRILFVRHGESQANLLHEISNRGLKHGLTRNGRAQAQTLAQQLRGRPIVKIYSSPLLRAIETCVILAGPMHLEYEVSDALREYDCGNLEGRADDDAWQRWRELFDAWFIQKHWDQRIEGGESFFDVKKRFEPFIDGLVKLYTGSENEVVCVSHGGLYWMMLPVVLKNVTAELITKNGFKYSTCIIAELQEDGLVCIEWNGTSI